MLKKYSSLFYKHSFFRYVFVGGSTFVLDFGILISLQHFTKLSLAVSTTIAYWIAIMYNFSLNRYWTFNKRETNSLKKHIVLYLLLLVMNYLITLGIVLLLSKIIFYGFAKVFAVCTQVIWTYPIYKKVIFVNDDNAAKALE